MSATQDKSQKITFVYSNLYELYKKGKAAAHAADVNPVDPNPEAEPRPFGARGLTTGKVIKAGEAAKVEAYTPTSFTANRIAERRPTPEILHQLQAKRHAQGLDSLRASLEQLKDVHARLKFMLGELQDFLKKS